MEIYAHLPLEIKALILSFYPIPHLKSILSLDAYRQYHPYFCVMVVQHFNNFSKSQIQQYFHDAGYPFDPNDGYMNYCNLKRIQDNRIIIDSSDYRQAINHIREYKNKSLDLRDHKLIHLPPIIGQLADLQHLDLSCNGLTSLPDELGSLTGLISLSIPCNDLKELPSWIGGMSYLTTLDLSYNRLESLPETITELKYLDEMQLSGNEFIKISQLPQLKSLGLSCCRFGTLPEGIRSLTRLRSLYLGGCNLSILPEWIGELNSLRTLNLSNNHLHTLPESINKIETLNKLYLYCNPLIEFPKYMPQYWCEIYISSDQEHLIDPTTRGSHIRYTIIYHI